MTPKVMNKVCEKSKNKTLCLNFFELNKSRKQLTAETLLELGTGASIFWCKIWTRRNWHSRPFRYQPSRSLISSPFILYFFLVTTMFLCLIAKKHCLPPPPPPPPPPRSFFFFFFFFISFKIFDKYSPIAMTATLRLFY